MKEALLYTKKENKTVACDLCAHTCCIAPGSTGVCRVRANIDGVLYAQTYGNVCAAHIDPIEKKPLYHVYPGSQSYSIATIGCNFSCLFCQNWHISQAQDRINGDERCVDPAEIVADAVNRECKTIACTYTEPTIYFEYAYDVARCAHEYGIATVFVTNGYMTRKAIDMMSPYVKACNVDLKAYSEDFYLRMCNARLQPVLDAIRYMKEAGIWVEVTTLVIPGENDSKDELSQLAHFIADVDPEMPWHISRFHPEYQFVSADVTPMKTLQNAYEIGREAGLKYVYLGNVLEGNNTFCHACGAVLIERQRFSASLVGLQGNACVQCKAIVSGIF